MSTKYEQCLLAHYVANVASRLRRKDEAAAALVRWIKSNRRVFPNGGRQLPPVKRGKDKLSAEHWAGLVEALREAGAELRRARPDRTARRIRRIGKSLRLAPVDIAILELLLNYETQLDVESLVDEVFHAYRLNPRRLALQALLGQPATRLRRRLEDGAPLVQLGLLSVDEQGDINIVARLHRLVTVRGGADEDMVRLLWGAQAETDLRWSDFDHVAADRDYALSILRGALRTGEQGVNILLYGAPGTGKTELCKVLAKRLGASLTSVGESDGEGNEPRRGERIQELLLAQRLLARDQSLLLFDEMDDLVSLAGSKVFMNRLLERAPAPTLWVVNDADEIEPSFLRRMTFAMALRPPTRSVQGRIWGRQLARHGIEAGEEEARALAQEFDVAPGVAHGATVAGRLSGGGVAAVRHGVRNLARVLACDRPPQRVPERFDPAFIRADLDPALLVERMSESDNHRFSLCLQGPPGTGKSALVRHLAERLGLEVVQRRASDLLSARVGGTEKRIARAFAEARDAQSFLVFDEADSLLADRSLARAGFEVSQVNEMLTWMESHPQPFACTTNFGVRLDPAALRRFTFKLALDYLDAARAGAAFRTYFGAEPPPEVEELAVLTAGDFQVVRRRAELLGALDDPPTLAAMLRAECEAKPGGRQRIGFRS